MSHLSDITQDASTGRLIGAIEKLAPAQRIAVYWDSTTEPGEKRWGLLTHYDPVAAVFEVALAAKIKGHNAYVTTGEWVPMARGDFTVFGPAPNPDAGPQTPRMQALKGNHGDAATRIAALCTTHELGFMPLEPNSQRFMDCARDLIQIGMGDFMSNEPAFQVRLDVTGKYDGSSDNQAMYPRSYRILVRPVMAPILHDEMRLLCDVADHYELVAQVASNGGGVEIVQSDDVG